eukprot:gene436-783_t
MTMTTTTDEYRTAQHTVNFTICIESLRIVIEFYISHYPDNIEMVSFESIEKVTSSDHKPVRAEFRINTSPISIRDFSASTTRQNITTQRLNQGRGNNIRNNIGHMNIHIHNHNHNNHSNNNKTIPAVKATALVTTATPASFHKPPLPADKSNIIINNNNKTITSVFLEEGDNEDEKEHKDSQL